MKITLTIDEISRQVQERCGKKSRAFESSMFLDDDLNNVPVRDIADAFRQTIVNALAIWKYHDPVDRIKTQTTIRIEVPGI